MAHGIAGVDYGPFRDGQDPELLIFPDRADLMADMPLLAAMATDIRIYSLTNGFEQIVDLAERAGLGVVPSAFLNDERKDFGPAANRAEIDALARVAGEPGHDFPFVVVGSEAIQGQGFTSLELVARIEDLRGALPGDVRVTTAEPWHVWLANPELAAAVDLLFVNIHPFNDRVPAKVALDYLGDRLTDLREAFPDKEIVISEFGWPTAGEVRGPALPSVGNQERLLEDFLSMAQAEGLDVFAFEAFDESWKAKFEAAGAHFGLLEEDRTPKHDLVTLRPVAGVELEGGPGADALLGSPAGDLIRGRGGNDGLRGRTGDDILFGGGGADVIRGGAGRDVVLAGPGADVVRGGVGPDVLDGGPGPDRLLGGTGADFLHGQAGRDVIRGFGGDDLIAGGRGRDTLFGNGGPDLILGGAGADTIRGGRGRDKLEGGAGDDLVIGGRGADEITGGPGDDTLRGGPGPDRFVYENVRDGLDRIEDFTPGPGGDVLVLAELLEGFEPGISDPADFVVLSDDGTDTTVGIDVNGAAGGVVARNLVVLEGLSGVDLEVLVTGPNVALS